jgi:hypothetical protein
MAGQVLLVAVLPALLREITTIVYRVTSVEGAERQDL